MIDAAMPTRPHWFGHPPGLTILFLTETWEKFSYYGMRALLVYYMVRGLGFTPAKASLLYGCYTGLAYLTPIGGAYLSDHVLGYRKAVMLGGTIMAFGHFLMAFPALFYPALLTIAAGNGLFLPSLPSQVARLYGDDDPRQLRAYSIYYVGINLGAVLAPLICGFLAEAYGWHWGFGAAGVGMLGGLLIFTLGGSHLPAVADRRTMRSSGADEPREDRRHTISMLVTVFLLVVLFRGAYEQMGNGVALWALEMNRSIGATRAIPLAWFQTLNPLFVFALTPLVTLRWKLRARAGRPPSTLRSMAGGALMTATAFVVLAAVAQYFTIAGTPAHWPWLALFILAYTWGELHILPTGLALFGQAAPPSDRAMGIAAWYFAICLGSLLAGVVGTLFTVIGPGPFFALCGVFAGFAAAGLTQIGRSSARGPAPH